MLGTLEKDRSRPQRAGTAVPQLGAGQNTVTAAFVSTAHMERDCIRLYAQTHPEICAQAILPGGQELLRLLRNGLRPQVLVLDVLLTDMGILSLIEQIRALHLEPQPTLLLTVPAPERTAARRAVQAFANCEVILKPYSLKELFDQIYLLGAGTEQYRLYHIRCCCRRYLQQMQADPAMSGCDYLEQMLMHWRQTVRCRWRRCTNWWHGTTIRRRAALRRPSCGYPKRCNGKLHRCITRCAFVAVCRKTRYCPTENC